MKAFVRNRRAGVSLVELVIIMSAWAVLLTLSVTLLHRIMHVQKRATAAIDIQRTLWRLEATFRRDVHGAPSLADQDNEPEEQLVRLQLPGEETIEYRRAESAIERVLLTKGEVTSREQFVFSQVIEASIDRADAGLITLAITSRERPVSGSPIAFHVSAVTRRDRVPTGLILVKEAAHE